MTVTEMEAFVRAYFEACNTGDPAHIATYFEPDAVHYFPPGMYGGPFRGALEIGKRWQYAVENFGSYWTVDQFMGEPRSRRAVIEWSHFKRKQHTVLRGDEWYRFSPRGLIEEIRAYYASPQNKTLAALELGGFDYAGRGYPLNAPPI